MCVCVCVFEATTWSMGAWAFVGAQGSDRVKRHVICMWPLSGQDVVRVKQVLVCGGASRVKRHGCVSVALKGPICVWVKASTIVVKQWMRHRCVWVAFKGHYFHKEVQCKASGLNVGKKKDTVEFGHVEWWYLWGC